MINLLSNGDIKYTTKNIRTSYIKKGNIMSLYDKSCYNTGYIGEGHYSFKSNENMHKSWVHIMERGYDSKLKEKYNTYKNVTVDPYFHNLQNFGKWYDENYYEFEGETMCLDKDILIKGNKIYSPNTCCFVPQYINVLFTKCDKTRGDLPLGVTQKYKKYYSHISIKNENQKIGGFDIPEEAFYAYKEAKETEIKRIADYYLYEKEESIYHNIEI